MPSGNLSKIGTQNETLDSDIEEGCLGELIVLSHHYRDQVSITIKLTTHSSSSSITKQVYYMAFLVILNCHDCTPFRHKNLYVPCAISAEQKRNKLGYWRGAKVSQS